MSQTRPYRLTAILLGMSLALLAYTPAAAYTLQRNNYPSAPVGCDNSPAYPCIEWPRLSNGLSSTTYIYLDASLTSITAVNMKQDARDAFGRWNSAPANSPWLRESSTLSGSSGYSSYGYPTLIYADFGLPFGVYASTIDLTPNDFNSGIPDRYTIVVSQVEVSQSVAWNHSFNYACTSSPCHSDSRKVVTHELGHLLGLGHTGHTAVMQQGAVNFYNPTSDDFLGLQVAYGAG